MNNNPVVEPHLSRDDVIILSNLAASKIELVRQRCREIGIKEAKAAMLASLSNL